MVVRPDPESPGYYQIVQGRHRYYVVAKMMKEEVIACRVFEDMSEEEAELATLSENACRTNAKPTDRLSDAAEVAGGATGNTSRTSKGGRRPATRGGRTRPRPRPSRQPSTPRRPRTRQRSRRVRLKI